MKGRTLGSFSSVSSGRETKIRRGERTCPRSHHKSGQSWELMPPNPPTTSLSPAATADEQQMAPKRGTRGRWDRGWGLARPRSKSEASQGGSFGSSHRQDGLDIAICVILHQPVWEHLALETNGETEADEGTRPCLVIVASPGEGRTLAFGWGWLRGTGSS